MTEPNDDIVSPTATDQLAEPFEQEYIISYAWHQGLLSVAYLSQATMELSIVEETIDLRPDFITLTHLHRNFNYSHILATGPPAFLHKICAIFEFPIDTDLAAHKVDKGGGHHARHQQQMPATSNNATSASALPLLFIYPCDEGTSAQNRNRILRLELPEMPRNLNDTDRQAYIGTVLPLHQTQVVQCLGNLLNFADVHFRQQHHQQPFVITDLKVVRMDDYVTVDNSTLFALHIFEPIELSGGGGSLSIAQQAGQRQRHEPTLYGLLNRGCCSRYGSHHLMLMMLMPTRNVDELNFRYDTIDWCARNAAIVKQLRSHLRYITDLSQLYTSLLRNCNRYRVWKRVFNVVGCMQTISGICQMIGDQMAASSAHGDSDGGDRNPPSELMHFFRLIGCGPLMSNLMDTLKKVVDIDACETQKRLVVNAGFDSILDELKKKFCEISGHLLDLTEREFAEFSMALDCVQVIYIDLVGFVITARK